MACFHLAQNTPFPERGIYRHHRSILIFHFPLYVSYLDLACFSLIKWCCLSSFSRFFPTPVGTPLKMLLFFSAISNTRHLLRTENTEKNKPLLFLGGFKVILIFWVIYGHAYIMVQLEFARKFVCPSYHKPNSCSIILMLLPLLKYATVIDSFINAGLGLE